MASCNERYIFNFACKLARIKDMPTQFKCVVDPIACNSHQESHF